MTVVERRVGTQPEGAIAPFDQGSKQTQTTRNYAPDAIALAAAGLAFASKLPGPAKILALGATSALELSGCTQKGRALPNATFVLDRVPMPTPTSTTTPSPKPVSTAKPTPVSTPSPTPSPTPTPVPSKNPLINPIFSADPFLTREAFTRKIAAMPEYTDKPDVQNKLLKIWDILQESPMRTGLLASDLKMMRRLLETGQVILRIDSKAIAEADSRALGTYRNSDNIMTLPDTWTGKTLKEKMTVVHELKHAVDDFRLFSIWDDRFTDVFNEGTPGYQTWAFTDRQTGIIGILDPENDKDDATKAIDAEFSAKLTECQFAISLAGYDPDQRLTQREFKELAGFLDAGGHFLDKDGKFDKIMAGTTIYVLSHYYNLPTGAYTFNLREKTTISFKKTMENLTQLLESLYQDIPEFGSKFVGGGRPSVIRPEKDKASAYRLFSPDDMTAQILAELKGKHSFTLPTRIID